jgi:hypothetical protein
MSILVMLLETDHALKLDRLIRCAFTVCSNDIYVSCIFKWAKGPSRGDSDTV